MTILKDTSLCSIVRDEKMNPAGGIQRFVDSHVPFVEKAVIADTGSVDGTREILEEMQAKYSNLKVVDIPFEGYADARNRAMEHVKTKRVLILDADELLTHEKPQDDWKILKNFIEENPAKGYWVNFTSLYPNGRENLDFASFGTHHIRIFNLSSHIFFKGVLWEYILYSMDLTRIENPIIKHFSPSKSALKTKKANWYLHLEGKPKPSDREYLKHFETPPSQLKGFAGWKAFNPLRNNYV